MALAALGIEALCERIASGETQREIAKSLGCSAAAVNSWLAHPERSARAQSAMAVGAEAMQDRGHQALLDALGGSQADVALARALDQHWARRAAIRNPAHRERSDSTITATIAVGVQALSMQQLEAIAAQGLPMVERVEPEPPMIKQ